MHYYANSSSNKNSQERDAANLQTAHSTIEWEGLLYLYMAAIVRGPMSGF